MADYIYLLQTRLTAAQQAALNQIREIARARNMTVFLVGGAVRDLTSGSPVRDLDIAVQGNATKLRKDLGKTGATIVGENDTLQTLYLNFPGGVRVELGSTLSVTFPKPGKMSVHPATILDDLRRRDFTANAMAVSLNEGSFGLLMDPLNGVADLENRELRLVSNYGFIEDPSRMIRAARLQARLGWQLEERTAQRYQTGKDEGYISELAPAQRAYELEEVFHEEDPLRAIRKLEAEGWAKELSSHLSSAKANETELERLRDTVGQLEQMGIHPDPSAAYFPLVTAKLSPKESSALIAEFARPGFGEQIAALDSETKAFAAQFTGKAAAAPSEAWRLLYSANPEAVLWLAHTAKSGSVQAKFKAFFNDWSQARQKIPYQLMQEMRITPDLPGYDELVEKLFFAIMDGKLDTPEAAKAFLEPYSPPAPPPPVSLRRRPVKREGKATKGRGKKSEVAPEQLDAGSDDEGAPAIAAVAEPAVAVEEPGTAGPAAEPAAVPTRSSAAKSPAKEAAKTPAHKAAHAPAAAKSKPAASSHAPARPEAAKAKPGAPAKNSAKPQPKPAAPKKASTASKPAAAKGKAVKVQKPAAKVGNHSSPARGGAKHAAPAKKAAPKTAAKGHAAKKAAPGKKAGSRR